MGQTTFVRTSPAVSKIRSKPSRLWLDIPLVLAVIALTIIGLLMVYSASWNYVIPRKGDPAYLLNRQLLWAIFGIVVALIISMIDYHHLARLAVPIMAITLLMLLVVLWSGGDSETPARTLFGTSVQPSEMAKLVIIIYLSVWLYSKRDQIASISFGLIPMMFILGITAGLILLQPDLSAAATIVVLGCLLFFICGGELRQIVLVVVVVVLLGALVVSVSQNGQNRISYYINGLQDPLRAHDHIKRSLEAVVRGGIFGVGIGKGITKFTGLPFSWTDSIFAVIAEETGLLGACVVIGLYILVLWRGFGIARKAPDQLGYLLASGVTIWITMEAMINIGAMVNLVPFAGNALPFISAGGSNLTMTLSGIGILLSIARQTAKGTSTAGVLPVSTVKSEPLRQVRASRARSHTLGGEPVTSAVEENEYTWITNSTVQFTERTVRRSRKRQSWRFLDALFNLRRRNGRRRISRTDRPANTRR
ncbi:MAG: putative peptidoglycan glycosyltransferase FtsW [Anaerolineales bacterium]